MEEEAQAQILDTEDKENGKGNGARNSEYKGAET